MTKVVWKAGTMLSPLPPALVSCGTVEEPCVLTVAWTGIVSSTPPMSYVSIKPERNSHHIIKEAGEFVINLPNLAMITAVDWCGVKSGKNVDKFKEMNLTAAPSSQIKAPQILEAPVSVECKVVSVTNHGSHDMFLAEILAVNVDDKYLDKNGKLCLEKAGLIAFSHGKYFTLGRELGSFGFSVNKRRLEEVEKMKTVEVAVKQSKFIADKETKEKPKKEFKPKRKFDDKPRGEKRFDDKPRRPREDEDRPKRDFKPRDRDDRPKRDFGDKPRGERRFDDKPRRPREDGDRPKRDFGDKPRGERRFDDKPRRPREDNKGHRSGENRKFR